MKKTVFIPVFLFLFFQYAFAQTENSPEALRGACPEYTLQELFVLALDSSEQVGISGQDLILAERGREKALSSLLPRVSAFGEFTRYSEERNISGDIGIGSFSIQPESSSAWGLRIDQSLSLGGREIRNFRISRNAIESSKYALHATKEAYLLRVAEAFYDVLKALKTADISRENVKRLGKYRDDAKIRLQVGEVTKTALLRAEAELSGAQSDRIRTENILVLAKAVLARVAGIEGEYGLKESSPEDTVPADDLQSLSSLKTEAMQERSELKSNQMQKIIAAEQVGYAKGAYWPTLSLEGVYLKRDEDPSSPFLNDESMYGVLRLDFPFFEGGLRRAEVREAEAREKQAQLSYEYLKKEIYIEVESAYLALKTQKGMLKSLQDQLEFAKENYHAVSKQFTYGLADSIDVVDANTLLVESERQLSRAHYDYKLASLVLKRATGTLFKIAVPMQ